MCRSVPQMVVASTRTMASPSSKMTGSGTSFQLFDPGPSYTSAFIAHSSVSVGSSLLHHRSEAPAGLGPKVHRGRRSVDFVDATSNITPLGLGIGALATRGPKEEPETGASELKARNSR